MEEYRDAFDGVFFFGIGRILIDIMVNVNYFNKMKLFCYGFGII